MFKDLLNRVVRLVNSWKPKGRYRKETGYLDDLLNYLADDLGAAVEKESGRKLCDIAVGEKVGIELKMNLHSSGQINTLMGQLDSYVDSYPSGLIVVLVGKTDDSKYRELLRRVWRWSSRGPISMGLSRPRRIRVVNKGGGAMKKRRTVRRRKKTGGRF